jgi:hypothetical protein
MPRTYKARVTYACVLRDRHLHQTNATVIVIAITNPESSIWRTTPCIVPIALSLRYSLPRLLLSQYQHWRLHRRRWEYRFAYLTGIITIITTGMTVKTMPIEATLWKITGPIACTRSRTERRREITGRGATPIRITTKVRSAHNRPYVSAVVMRTARREPYLTRS